MQLIAPDFARRIDLPGVGPCPRPVDIDQSLTGFNELVSMRIYSFAGAAPINGEAEDDEVLIVLLDGTATIEVSGPHTAVYKLDRQDLRAIYLPAGHHYRLTPTDRADIAYMRAKPRATKPPQGFRAGAAGELAIEDYADRLQLRLLRLPPAGAFPAETTAGPDVERLVHALGTNPADEQATLAPWHNAALAKGEQMTLSGPGELLIVAAR